MQVRGEVTGSRFRVVTMEGHLVDMRHVGFGTFVVPTHVEEHAVYGPQRVGHAVHMHGMRSILFCAFACNMHGYMDFFGVVYS